MSRDEKKAPRPQTPRPMRDGARQRWCFTINNYTNEHEEQLKKLFEEGVVKYLVYGREVAPETKTPHLQGYLNFGTTRKRLQTVKNLCPALSHAHLEGAKGNGNQNRTYCIKEGDFVEFGEVINQGKRTDLDDMKARVQEGVYDMYELLTEFPSAWKYQRVLGQYIRLAQKRRRAPTDPLAGKQLYEWQKTCLSLVTNPAPERKVHWFLDPVGANGKTTLAMKLMCDFPGEVFYTSGGRFPDIAFAYLNEGMPDNIILDFPRDKEEYVNYGAIENFKNGIFTSPKYASQTVFRSITTVIVFANFEPDRSKLSEDRWQVHNIRSL